MKNQKTIIEKGENIYYRIKPILEKEYEPGYFVTIEVNSGKFFVGKTPIDALHKAKRTFPKKQFFLAQIGRLAGTLK